MDYKQVRKGITNAEFNEDKSNILFFEFVVIAVVVGLITRSWWWGGGLFLGLSTAIFIKPLAIVLVAVLSIGWGAIGYGIGSLFESTGAAVVLVSSASWRGSAFIFQRWNGQRISAPTRAWFRPVSCLEFSTPH